MEGIEERASFDVAEALEADLGNLHPEDEALIESVVAAGETTQATQDSQQATAAAVPTEATTATAPAAAAAPKKTRKRGFSYRDAAIRSFTDDGITTSLPCEPDYLGVNQPGSNKSANSGLLQSSRPSAM
jgi:hypothetical protein